jgi:hypothetical protein
MFSRPGTYSGNDKCELTPNWVMVELPPAVTDLNEYARFAFLNEMHALAFGIMSGDSTVCNNLRIAMSVIDAERNSMKSLFTGPYERPSSSQCVALLLRCAELYLEHGTWFELSHAELRLIESGQEQLAPTIRPIFAQTNETDKCLIQSPIIELILTRIELMHFFEDIFYLDCEGKLQGCQQIVSTPPVLVAVSANPHSRHIVA